MTTDFKTMALNEPLTDVDRLNECRVIYGGVGWPGKGAGFAVVAAMGWEKHFDSHDIWLLAEYESFDTRELVRQCGALDARYKPALWIGDNRNAAADRFINEMASELQNSIRVERFRAERQGPSQRSFYINPTMMLEMNQLYAYVLPHLKRLLDPERRTLFLKDSKTVNYLGAIEENEVSDLTLGEYPAIEALGFAVIEMRNHYPAEAPLATGDASNLAESYAWQKTPFD